jgi:outer membrane protein assembly factor BamB
MKPSLWAIRADGAGEVTTTHANWTTTRQVPVMSSPLLLGDTLFWTSDDGMANCVNAKDGEAHWQERLNQQHLASLLLAEGRIYFFGKEGKTTVVKADRTFEKLAENQLDGTVIATPAVVDGTIFLRTDTHLYRIRRLNKNLAYWEAKSDFVNGRLRLLRIAGENWDLKFTGEKEGPFQIWLAVYFPTTGEMNRYSEQQHVYYFSDSHLHWHIG